MNLEEIHLFCLKKLGVTEEFPFDQSTLVFKVGGKIFALIDIESATSINLKCDPEKAIQLREEFEEIQPGFHMNKKHWNTVSLVDRLSQQQIQEMISHSYDLVFNSLPKKVKHELENR